MLVQPASADWPAGPLLPLSEAELAWLGERVEALGRVVEVICTEHIAALERSAAA